MSKSVLVILHPGFEELEAVAPIDLMMRAGLDVTQASLGGDPSVTGKNGITLTAGYPLADLAPDAFDAVVLPGGPGIKGVREDGRCAQVLKAFHDQGKVVACICAAPTVLLDAGILPARYTAHASTRDELPDASADPVVVDGKVITSTGAGTAIQFGLQLVTTLTDQATADTIADSIAWAGTRGN